MPSSARDAPSTASEAKFQTVNQVQLLSPGEQLVLSTPKQTTKHLWLRWCAFIAVRFCMAILLYLSRIWQSLGGSLSVLVLMHISATRVCRWPQTSVCRLVQGLRAPQRLEQRLVLACLRFCARDGSLKEASCISRSLRTCKRYRYDVRFAATHRTEIVNYVGVCCASKDTISMPA